MPESRTAQTSSVPVALNERCAASHFVVTTVLWMSALTSKFGQILWIAHRGARIRRQGIARGTAPPLLFFLNNFANLDYEVSAVMT